MRINKLTHLTVFNAYCVSYEGILGIICPFLSLFTTSGPTRCGTSFSVAVLQRRQETELRPSYPQQVPCQGCLASIPLCAFNFPTQHAGHLWEKASFSIPDLGGPGIIT